MTPTSQPPTGMPPSMPPQSAQGAPPGIFLFFLNIFQILIIDFKFILGMGTINQQPALQSMPPQNIQPGPPGKFYDYLFSAIMC